MIRENAYKGQKVRVIDAPAQADIRYLAGHKGVITYLWYEWATVETNGISSYIEFADIEPTGLLPPDPHPVAFQEKLARLGWGAWQPTPGVTGEGAVLYITLGERHVFIMTTDEALALSDIELQKRIESAIGMSHEEACKIPCAPPGGTT
jgi:hypothetical protein